TVFVAVVDPGVGTARKSAALKTRSGHFFVGPDNGIFTLAIRKLGLDRMVSIEDSSFVRQAVSTTFHGRDIYAPAAAWLARDPSLLSSFGPAITSPVMLNWPEASPAAGAISGTLLRVETPYGNVWTNIEEKAVRESGLKEGGALAITLGDRVLNVPFVRTFGEVEKGAPLAYINSRGLLSLALNMADFSAKFSAQAGQPVSIKLPGVK
ncbi:MAG TPA: SAM-dependent chlorinase/fluorinase, partial [Elusimicrobiales bacterium]|nr:SAM-dependent chlorinase/fluorinase [Elusimicrobiales bacterium]